MAPALRSRGVALFAIAITALALTSCSGRGSSDDAATSDTPTSSAPADTGDASSEDTATQAPEETSAEEESSTEEAAPAAADPGVTDSSILIGGSFPFSGPLAAYGSLSKGVDIYFKMINDEGGVNGRTLEYTTTDDAYDPSRLATNARQLVEKDKVFAFVSFGGTNLAIRDYMKSQGVPQFVMAGNSPLSDIANYPTTRAWWPDIRLESEVTTKTVLAANPDAKIGTLGLDNDITASQAEGVKDGLGADHADQLVLQETYTATATDLSGQINRLKAAGVDTLLSGFGGPQAVNAVNYMHQIGWNPQIYNYSGSTNIVTFVGQAGEAAVGLHVVTWGKDSADPQWANDPGMQKFVAAVQKYGDGANALDPAVLNGYAFGEALAAILGTMETPTRAGLLQAWDSVKGLENDTLLPGTTLNAGSDGRLVHEYRLATWNGKSWDLEGDMIDATPLLSEGN